MWDVSELESYVSRSQHGAEIIKVYRQADYQIEVRSANADPLLLSAAGYHKVSGNKKLIVLRSDLTLPHAICTLCHEGEHARQAETLKVPDPSKCTLAEYAEKVRLNEARAESIANAVAYDLYKQGILEPLGRQIRADASFAEQARSYAAAREAKKSHHEAAAISEPLVFNIPDTLQFYETGIKQNWVDANPTALQIPEVRDVADMKRGAAVMTKGADDASEKSSLERMRQDLQEFKARNWHDTEGIKDRQKALEAQEQKAGQTTQKTSTEISNDTSITNKR